MNPMRIGIELNSSLTDEQRAELHKKMDEQSRHLEQTFWDCVNSLPKDQQAGYIRKALPILVMFL